MFSFFFILAVSSAAVQGTVTMDQAQSMVCEALCAQDGADAGYYLPKEDSCLCGFKKKYKEMKSVKLVVRTSTKADKEY